MELSNVSHISYFPCHPAQVFSERYDWRAPLVAYHPGAASNNARLPLIDSSDATGQGGTEGARGACAPPRRHLSLHPPILMLDLDSNYLLSHLCRLPPFPRGSRRRGATGTWQSHVSHRLISELKTSSNITKHSWTFDVLPPNNCRGGLSSFRVHTHPTRRIM